MIDRSPSWVPSPSSATLALLLLVPVPSIGVWVALHGPRDATGAASMAAQGVWLLSKLWVLLFPVLWHRFVDHRMPRIPRPDSRGMPAALTSGLLFVIVIAGAYWLFGSAWIDAGAAGARMAEAGLDRRWIYLLMAVYWCTINSLLEEYVWRWFVFTRCEAILPRQVAVLAAGLFFAIHHAVGLAGFFGDARVVVLATLGVWAGGATWSWIYLRWRNIYAAYVSHVCADLVIFWIGYRLIFSGS